MARIFRWLVRIAGTMILAGALAVTLIVWFASRSLPDYDDTLEVAGLSAPLEIVRDNANIPHIFGETDADVFFGLGYAHAQDRLWQMLMLRRTVNGKLSELFGARTLPTDRLMRRLDLDGAAAASVRALDDDTRAALDAYSRGVNAWLAEVNAGARGRGAPEMWLFNHALSPWTPADSVAVVKLMALQLNAQIEDEVLRARVSLLLEPERVADIMPDAPGAGVAALPRFSSLIEEVPVDYAFARPEDDALFPVQRRGFGGASNAWAAGITRSAAGATLLANDPHLGLTAPSIWYLARLELSTGGVIGGTIPGVPLVLTGRSADLGWGITAAYVDDTDIHVEEVNPSNAGEYRTPDGWRPFRNQDSIVEVRDGVAETLRLQWTENGPVLSPDMFDLGTIRPPGHVTTISWTALSREDTSVEAGLRLMRAASVAEAVEAMEGFVAPALNVVLADRTRIGMKTVGHVPRRDPAHQSEGRIPTYGYLAENRWQGVMDYASNPAFMAPAGGIVGNTNNKIIDQPFPEHLSFTWGDTQRINRWRFLMQQRGVHTRESFIETQLDTVSFTARSLLPLIGAELWFTGEAAPEGTPERRRERALQLLAEWNGEMNEHLPEPLIYAAWVRALQDRLIRDELGPLSRAFLHVEPVFIERVYRDVDGAAAWCDVLQSAPTESCVDIARMALDDALVFLDETYGAALDSLRWGDAHEAVHEHPVLGEVPVLEWFVNIRQSTSGGDQTLMRGLTRGGQVAPFENVHAAGFRAVFDFADPDSSVFITATGQSGHFLSRHYDDMGELWRRGEYIPMSLDPALARAAAVGVTRLLPEG